MSSGTPNTSVFWGNQHDDAPDTWRKHRAGSDFSPAGTSQVTLRAPSGRSAAQAANPARRTLMVVMGVLMFHVVLLWALQSGLLKRVVALVVPVQMISEFVEPPAPKVAPPPPQPPAPTKPMAKKPQTQSLAPAPIPLAVVDPSPPADAPRVEAAPPVPLPPITAPVARLAEPAPAPPAPPQVQLPSSDADYLQNPKPVYPPLSKRLGEQGGVVHSVLIGTDGLPVSAKLVKSSGFERLDQAAYNAVMRWRYTPGKRNGTPTAMAFNVPINWVLE